MTNEVLRRLRASRAALAWAVVEVERLGGCVDLDCELEECWLAMPSADSEGRRELERAIAFVTEQEPPDEQMPLAYGEQGGQP